MVLGKKWIAKHFPRGRSILWSTFKASRNEFPEELQFVFSIDLIADCVLGNLQRRWTYAVFDVLKQCDWIAVAKILPWRFACCHLESNASDTPGVRLHAVLLLKNFGGHEVRS
jgi:hypothetical protein